MFRSIVVPLDGTSYGECAVPIAREIAYRVGATLHLVHVHSDIPVTWSLESLAMIGAPLPSDASEKDIAYLEKTAQDLRESGLRVETAVLNGSLEEELEEFAVARADLIVACTHSHAGLMRIWHRSLGERLVRDVGVPTLLVHGSRGHGEELVSEFRHLLVPLSGAPAAEAALISGVGLASAFDAPITLLQVIQPAMVVGYTLLGQSAHVNDFVVEERVRGADAYLSSVAERLRTAGVRVFTRVAIAEETSHAIVDSLRARPTDLPPIDLVILATHGHPPFVRAVWASVSDTLLHLGRVPVLLHRNAAAAAERLALGDRLGSAEREPW